MKKTQGNLIDLAENGIFDVIVHGCNCFHTMGAGIAKEIKERYPAAFTIDKFTTSYGDEKKLGTISHVVVFNPKRTHSFVIINAYTQFRLDGAEYAYVRKAFKTIKQRFSGRKIGVPAIGCGLGGLEWKEVEKIIEEELVNEDVTFVEFKR